jgi:pimeloyl-ACP methyl ester carboxylesterase
VQKREFIATAVAAAIIGAVPAVRSEESTQTDKGAGMTVTSKDGTTIAFERRGSGPVLLFVSGALQFRGSDAPTKTLLDRLAQRFTVVFYDRRGRGGSGDTLPYSVAREVEDLDAVITASGGHALLFAESSGALLAIEAAASGLPIDRLALYEPPLIVDDSAPGVPPDYVETIDRLMAKGDAGKAVAYFFAAPQGIPAADLEQALTSDPGWPVYQKVARTIAYDARLMTGAYRNGALQSERWGSITIPALVINGSASFVFMPAAADAVAAALPNAQRATLAAQGHDPEPDVIAPLLEQFLSA